MRVVICCEHGVPSELIRDALLLGKALIAKGHVPVYLVGDPIALVDNAGAWTPNELYQAPVLRPPPHLVMNRPPVDGLADLMAVRGFEDKQSLITLASMWNQQLEALEPDAIIGFQAPVLWLVGPSHAPTFALGNGFTLPPILGTSFPRLSVDSTPVADEQVMLANANAVLARMGQPALASLSEVLSGCNPTLYGLPACDPYLRFRQSLTTGLLGAVPRPALPAAKPRIAALLDVYCPGIEMLVLALAGSTQIPIDICVIGATTTMRRFLEQQAHIKVWKDYPSLLEHTADAHVLVHHGVQDITQHCIALGRPQLLIPWTREQETLNYMVGWMGFTWSKPTSVPIDEMAITFRDLLRDESLVVAAQHHAIEFARSELGDAVPQITQRIEAKARNGSLVAVHSFVRDHPLEALPPVSHRVLGAE